MLDYREETDGIQASAVIPMESKAALTSAVEDGVQLHPCYTLLVLLRNAHVWYSVGVTKIRWGERKGCSAAVHLQHCQ